MNGVKHEGLKGKGYSYLGHFKEAKHLQRGHNTIPRVNRVPSYSARLSGPVPSQFTPGAAAIPHVQAFTAAQRRAQTPETFKQRSARRTVRGGPGAEVLSGLLKASKQRR